jgi:hypothetical protein
MGKSRGKRKTVYVWGEKEQLFVGKFPGFALTSF